MVHPLDRPVASDLSLQVLQKQRRDPQVTLTPLHQTHRIQETVGYRWQGLRDLDRAEPTFLVGDEVRTGRFWKHGKR